MESTWNPIWKYRSDVWKVCNVILSMLLRGVAFLRKDLFCLLGVLEWGPPLVYSFWAVDPMGPTWGVR